MHIVCLDLEGVLVPEIWVNVATRTGIEALRQTTRDNPDYDDLMRQRMKLIDGNGLKLPDIQAMVADMAPLDGAQDFLDWLRARFQVVVLSDVFYELAAPLMHQLGHPTMFCHSLETNGEGRITGYRLRLADAKRQAVRGFHGLNFRVIAVGDSYNDIGMLGEADTGIFYRPPDNVVRDHPAFAVTGDYTELQAEIERAGTDLSAAAD